MIKVRPKSAAIVSSVSRLPALTPVSVCARFQLSSGWGDCDPEPGPSSEGRFAWQELERAALSLSVPAELEQFTKIQR